MKASERKAVAARAAQALTDYRHARATVATWTVRGTPITPYWQEKLASSAVALAEAVEKLGTGVLR